MLNPDWNKNSYKNLDEQRQDAENAQIRTNNRSISRIVLGVIAVVIVLLKNIPEDVAESVFAFLPVLGLFLAFAFPILIGSVFFTLARRKFKRENFYAEEVPEFPDRNKRPTQAGERYPAAQAARPAQPEERYPAASSGRDYSKHVDSWDIKDPKPPWEL